MNEVKDYRCIEFEDPDDTLPGEYHSKLLKKDSTLYLALKDAFNTLPQKGMGSQRPPHIELIKGGEPANPTLLVERAQRLQGAQIQFPLQLRVMNGKAVVVSTPAVKGYGQTHITVAYYPKGAPAGIQDLGVPDPDVKRLMS